jgi:hypothetical protein
MRHFLILQPFRQITRDIARSIVTEQTWLVAHDSLVAAGCRQSELDRGGDVISPHVCAKLPCDDVAAVIIKDRAEVIPTPADDLEVGKVRLLLPGK